ncbi:MAG: monovalent cation/H+ antiporter complex subunit F [Chloroflexota bacterium]|nr:monovalent cation/H+ antiporter complex subunit F [Chloroflexota bacterium]MDP9469651.1 monovalent cation/H+ antiporter complex subunit F [Chloroflexota bacterium]
MHETVFYLAAFWMTGLLGISVVLVIRARSAMVRILALDMLTLILIALLILYADARRSPYYLDAALVLALLSFVASLAAARYHSERKLFS